MADLAIVDDLPLSPTELVDEVLSDSDAAELAQKETIISRSLESFVDCGNALADIRDRRLYRQGYGSFEKYLKEKWGLGVDQAYRNIQGAEVARNLPESTPSPTAESQTRLLSRLEPDEQAAVWEEAVERSDGAPATAATVAEVMADRGHAVPASALPKDRPVKEIDSDGGSDVDKDVRLTPPDAVARVIKALGEIDLDPCSNSIDKPNIPAASHYDASRNGLLKKHIWAGRIFINPPYSTPLVWVERLVEGFRAGDIQEAIALLPCDSTTKWWDLISGASSAIALPKSRIKFLLADGSIDGSARFASVFFYLGDDFGFFEKVFAEGGYANIYNPSRVFEEEE